MINKNPNNKLGKALLKIINSKTITIFLIPAVLYLLLGNFISLINLIEIKSFAYYIFLYSYYILIMYLEIKYFLWYLGDE
ncbi:MAG TPA: hypothetical protein PK993_03975 [Clostridia bacterium]|nr:hypothetical protein [Clostridia bacterium]